MVLKILTVSFALFALGRMIVRYRKGGTLTIELILWFCIWSGIGAVVFIPHKTDRIAHWLGVSSGFNALTFITITGLLFAVYRLFSRVSTLQRDLTKMVRAVALQQVERPAATASTPPLPPPTPASLPPPG